MDSLGLKKGGFAAWQERGGWGAHPPPVACSVTFQCRFCLRNPAPLHPSLGSLRSPLRPSKPSSSLSKPLKPSSSPFEAFQAHLSSTLHLRFNPKPWNAGTWHLKTKWIVSSDYVRGHTCAQCCGCVGFSLLFSSFNQSLDKWQMRGVNFVVRNKDLPGLKGFFLWPIPPNYLSVANRTTVFWELLIEQILLPDLGDFFCGDFGRIFV